MSRKIRLVALIVAATVLIDALDGAYDHYELSMCSLAGKSVMMFVNRVVGYLVGL